MDGIQSQDEYFIVKVDTIGFDRSPNRSTSILVFDLTMHYVKVEKWAKKSATLKTFFFMDVDAKGTKF